MVSLGLLSICIISVTILNLKGQYVIQVDRKEVAWKASILITHQLVASSVVWRLLPGYLSLMHTV